MTFTRQLMKGASDSFPMLIGAAPFGVIYGALALSAGLTPSQAVAMSLLVFAGSAQFIVLSLLGASASIIVILLTTLVINLRHALYSATLQPYVRHLSRRWRMMLAFGLTDESFAVVQQKYLQAEQQPYREAYFLGSVAMMYSGWQLFTLMGVAFGRAMPELASWGLDFAMLATFIGIVVPQLKHRPQLCAALVAAAVSLITFSLPYKIGLMLSAVAGVLAGMHCQRWVRP
ncbi:AzlC family ABC transporter permease [Thiopseudomonas alkaliphila]|uniref:AzlC family ABC transporter permease n=1 Tax=Thiopseudomonas alkaliphila TaxID=1697053 RepID=UPI00069E1C39|nr:AzlC family ABC transporter permease [Thiopseudomonas alkaliphila]AKX54103.1 branched-chain amino acid ABC transporter permease [Thiopseudomonas alkaliphila]AKX54915.1 branched-chain amino acid ABC transporter permease [Thiopseudomonas alkaliphila]